MRTAVLSASPAGLHPVSGGQGEFVGEELATSPDSPTCPTPVRLV